MVKTQILKARVVSRNSLLERENTRTSESKLTFNITYYPAFQNVRSILQELQILLAPDKEHKKVFSEVPIVGFRNGKSLKDYNLGHNILRLFDVLPNLSSTTSEINRDY